LPSRKKHEPLTDLSNAVDQIDERKDGDRRREIVCFRIIGFSTVRYQYQVLMFLEPDAK